MANLRKPDNVHKLNGTYDASRHGNPDDKPEWDEGFPDMPRCVAEDDGAKEEWNRVMSEAPEGVIIRTDVVLLAMHCVIWSQYNEDPSTFLAADLIQMRMIEKELGFTPSSRGNITGTPKSKKNSGFQSNPR